MRVGKPIKPRTEPVSPWAPSRRAMDRVPEAHRLPAPTCCRYCYTGVSLVENKEIYGRNHGEWPWVYRCQNPDCGAYVGMHPFTNIPLGTIADRELRTWRQSAKNVFNLLWQPVQGAPWGKMERSEAYAWMAKTLQIEPHEAHVGRLEVDQCKALIAACRAFLGLNR